MLHRLLHHLGALQHERQNQLAGAELVADFLHRGEQHVVQHAHGLFAHAGGVECRPRCRPSSGEGPSSGPSAPASCDAVGSSTSAARAPPVPPRDSKCSMKRWSASGRRLNTRSSASARSLGADLGVRRDVRRVHDRHVEPGLDAVVQEHGVEHRARVRREPEAHVGDAEAREDARQLALDEADALDRLVRAESIHSSSPVASVKVSAS